VLSGGVAEDPGFWIRSRVLVLRIWQGAPATLAQVWTPVATSCDNPPIIGTFFVARVAHEEGRSVARRSYCDCDLTAAEAVERGSIAPAGVAIVSAATALVAVLLLVSFKALRRRRMPG
jgi:hypothetical protein